MKQFFSIILLLILVPLSTSWAEILSVDKEPTLSESNQSSILLQSENNLDFEKSPFYKSEIAENQGCLVNIGLQIKAAKFSSITPLKLIFEKPVVCKKNDIAVILKPESTTIRILGSGKIL